MRKCINFDQFRFGLCLQFLGQYAHYPVNSGKTMLKCKVGYNSARYALGD